jgi:putative tricarboxylic transport membrane protein
MSLSDWKQQFINLMRSSLIGTWIGILPGVGANIGSIVSYTTAKNLSKTRDRFGTGAPEGIVASEAANNATVCGALIPLISMGIPGSINDAILIGALILHGIQPGPLLFVNNPDVVYAIIATGLVANVMMYLIMVGTARYMARVVAVPKAYLLPAIAVFCVIGTYAVANRTFDVWTMLGFGIVGFLLERVGVPLTPFIIGFVLAPIGEEYLRSGLMISGGSFLPLLTRPMAASCIVISLVLLVWPFFVDWRRRRAPRSSHTSSEIS